MLIKSLKLAIVGALSATSIHLALTYRSFHHEFSEFSIAAVVALLQNEEEKDEEDK